MMISILWILWGCNEDMIGIEWDMYGIHTHIYIYVYIYTHIITILSYCHELGIPFNQSSQCFGDCPIGV